MRNIFSEKKAAHVAAFFLFQNTGRLNILKLMKLLYLAERRSYQLYGEPMIGDTLVSMDHGPVLSRTLDRLNGMSTSTECGLNSWMTIREGHDVVLRDPSVIRSPEEDLLELSDADLNVLNETWAEFGHMTQFQIRDYTHEHCAEWVDPEGSSYPITVEKLLSVLEFDEPQTRTLLQKLEERSAINAAFSTPV